MIACRSREPIRFIVKDERGEDNPTVFILRPDDRKCQSLVEAIGERQREGEDINWSWEYLKLAIVGIENFHDENGNPITEMPTDEDGLPTDEFLESIPMRYRMEVATEFMKRTSLTADDAKN